MAFCRWFSFPKVGYANSLEGKVPTFFWLGGSQGSQLHGRWVMWIFSWMPCWWTTGLQNQKDTPELLRIRQAGRGTLIFGGNECVLVTLYRELTYPTLGKGKLSSKLTFSGDMLVPRKVVDLVNTYPGACFKDSYTPSWCSTPRGRCPIWHHFFAGWDRPQVPKMDALSHVSNMELSNVRASPYPHNREKNSIIKYIVISFYHSNRPNACTFFDLTMGPWKKKIIFWKGIFFWYVFDGSFWLQGWNLS